MPKLRVQDRLTALKVLLASSKSMDAVFGLSSRGKLGLGMGIETVLATEG